VKQLLTRMAVTVAAGAAALGIGLAVQPGSPSCSTPLAGRQGVDISSNNGSPDFCELRRQGIRFVYVKAEQAGQLDSTFFSDTARARDAGLSAAGAADFAADIREAGLRPGTLPPVLDMENFNGLSGGAVCAWLANTEADLRRDLHWSTVLVYTSPGLWRGCSSANGAYLFDADWDVTAPTLPPVWRTYVAWQYFGPRFGSNELSGMDRDKANGLLALAYPAAKPTPKPAPPKPKPKPVPPKPKPAPKPNYTVLVKQWRKERAQTLAAYHRDGCTAASTSKTCVALRPREHTLYLDIARHA